MQHCHKQINHSVQICAEYCTTGGNTMKIVGLISAVIGSLAFGYILAYMSYYHKRLTKAGIIVTVILLIILLLLLFLGMYIYKL
jgi:hypothetical protein